MDRRSAQIVYLPIQTAIAAPRKRRSSPGDRRSTFNCFQIPKVNKTLMFRFSGLKKTAEKIELTLHKVDAGFLLRNQKRRIVKQAFDLEEIQEYLIEKNSH